MRQIWQMQLTRVWDILHDECSHSRCRTVATVIHIPSGQYTTYKRLSTGTYAIGKPVQIGLENIPLKWMHEIMCRPHLNYERGTKTREVNILPSASRDMFLWKHRLRISSITWDIISSPKTRYETSTKESGSDTAFASSKELENKNETFCWVWWFTVPCGDNVRTC